MVCAGVRIRQQILEISQDCSLVLPRECVCINALMVAATNILSSQINFRLCVFVCQMGGLFLVSASRIRGSP